MDKKLKTILLIAIFALLIGSAVFAYHILSKKVLPQNDIGSGQNKGQISQNDQAPEKEKTKAPDFTVVDAHGNAVKLSDLLGKPIVLNFWASWCPPCKSEMPAFQEVYQEAGENISFMMVNLVDGQRETKETGAKYISEQGFSFPIYFDTKQEAANAYGIRSIPTTIFIDKDGYIVTGTQGALDAKSLAKGIDLIK